MRRFWAFAALLGTALAVREACAQRAVSSPAGPRIEASGTTVAAPAASAAEAASPALPRAARDGVRGGNGRQEEWRQGEWRQGEWRQGDSRGWRGSRGGHHHHDRPACFSFPWIWNIAYVPIYPYEAFGFSTALPAGFGFDGYLPPVGTNGPAPGGVSRGAAALPEPAPPPATHPEQKARAGRFVEFGDRNFGEQRYLAAVERYKTAAGIAPDLAEIYLRQAFAYVAMRKFELASAAFRRGLRLRDNWRGTPLRLDQIYGGALVAKTAHLEVLAKAVEDNPFDAELLVVLGMELFFDGEAERSRVFFSRAAQLGGNTDRLLDAFLEQPKPADAEAPPGGKVVF